MEEDITFNKLITKLNEFQKRHPQLNSFGFGNLIEFGKDVENTTPLYPLMFVVPQGITYQESLTQYSLQIFFADRLNDDNDGSVSIVSSMSQIARDLLGVLKLNEDFMYLGDYNFPVTAAPFLERFNDVLAGVSLTLNIDVSDYLDICQLNEYLEPTPTDFIMVVDTTQNGSPSDEMRLPIDISNGTIDWGDGNVDTNVTSTISSTLNHTYSTPGIYTIKISPELTRVSFSGGDDRRKLIDIKNWGLTSWSSMDGAFRDCQNLDISATDVPDLSNVTSMNQMFRICKNLKFNSSVGNWDVSNVSNMNFLFDDTLFNQDISNWDVSNVTTMSSMFANSPFNQPIGNWNVSKLTTMVGMFQNSDFNQPIGDWDVSNVSSLFNTFRNASSFNQDLSKWNTSKVGLMTSTFEGTNFNQDISEWDTSNVGRFDGMFKNSPFNQPIGNWDVSRCVIFSSMFEGTPFNQPIGDWDVSDGLNFQGMFQNSQFNQPIGNWNPSKATNLSNLFRFNTNFNQDISQWNVSTIQFFNAMFDGSTSFNQNLGDWNLRINGIVCPNMFNNSGLSPENYSRTLIGWANYVNSNNDKPSNVFSFGAVGLQYNNIVYGGNPYDNAVDARNYLVNTANWNITDGGQL